MWRVFTFYEAPAPNSISLSPFSLLPLQFIYTFLVSDIPLSHATGIVGKLPLDLDGLHY